MIIFVVSGPHAYTHRSLVGDHSGVMVNVLNYSELGQLRSPPRATYVFTDLDRLPTEMLRAAAVIYRQLRQQGAVVLNDPARVPSRCGLLRTLFRHGLNQFTAYRAEDGEKPARWPVFLRTEGDHISPLPELYDDWDALQRAVAQVVDRGIPLSRLLVVEFFAQPVRPGLFRKLASFRMGASSFAHVCVHDTNWIAKEGRPGIATAELYDEEFRIVRDNPYKAAIEAAFEIAGIDYGRADFGIVDGRVQVYEINSNPVVAFGKDHPNPIRLRSYGLFKENYFKALRAIDTPGEAAAKSPAAAAASGLSPRNQRRRSRN